MLVVTSKYLRRTMLPRYARSYHISIGVAIALTVGH